MGEGYWDCRPYCAKLTLIIGLERTNLCSHPSGDIYHHIICLLMRHHQLFPPFSHWFLAFFCQTSDFRLQHQHWFWPYERTSLYNYYDQMHLIRSVFLTLQTSVNLKLCVRPWFTGLPGRHFLSLLFLSLTFTSLESYLDWYICTILTCSLLRYTVAHDCFPLSCFDLKSWLEMCICLRGYQENGFKMDFQWHQPELMCLPVVIDPCSLKSVIDLLLSRSEDC